MFDHVRFVFVTLWLNVSKFAAVLTVGEELLVRQVDSVTSAFAINIVTFII